MLFRSNNKPNITFLSAKCVSVSLAILGLLLSAIACDDKEYGDAMSEGEGPDDPGHGPNRGFGNSAFPDTWSDDNAIKAVGDVANSPKSIWQQATGPGSGRNAPKTIGGPDPNAPLTTRNGRPVRFTVEGQNHSLDIRVIVEPGGEGIVTGFPINR